MRMSWECHPLTARERLACAKQACVPQELSRQCLYMAKDKSSWQSMQGIQDWTNNSKTMMGSAVPKLKPCRTPFHIRGCWG